MSENVKYLNDGNFDSSIATGVTLVDFYADWCGPCRMIAPIIQELASELEGQATVAKLDIETAQSIAAKFEVTSIPTVILFKDGAEVNRMVGVRDKKSMKNMVNEAL